MTDALRAPTGRLDLAEVPTRPAAAVDGRPIHRHHPERLVAPRRVHGLPA